MIFKAREMASNLLSDLIIWSVGRGLRLQTKLERLAERLMPTDGFRW